MNQGPQPSIDLYSEDAGGSGAPLLLVHGFLSSRAQWRANLDGLRSFTRPILAELYGHGRSPAPEDGQAYKVAAYIDAIESVRRRLGIERWFVCGQSFGAGLTLHYAAAHPERVLGQIFTNSMTALSPRTSTAEHLEWRALNIRQRGRAALEEMPFHPLHARRIDQAVKRELVADAARISPHAVIQAMRHTMPELYALDALRAGPVPTLLVNGTGEQGFQPLRDMLAHSAAHVSIVDLEGGHSINLDNPHGFVAAVRCFVESVLKAPAEGAGETDDTDAANRAARDHP